MGVERVFGCDKIFSAQKQKRAKFFSGGVRRAPKREPKNAIQNKKPTILKTKKIESGRGVSIYLVPSEKIILFLKNIYSNLYKNVFL